MSGEDGGRRGLPRGGGRPDEGQPDPLPRPARGPASRAGVHAKPGGPVVDDEVQAGGVVIGEVSRLTLDAPVWAKPAFGVELLLGEMPSTPIGTFTKKIIRQCEYATSVPPASGPISGPISEVARPMEQ